MKSKKYGNFRIDEYGHIEYYVGWCCLEYEDVENLKKILRLKGEEI